jgi:hypothetical protein
MCERTQSDKQKEILTLKIYIHIYVNFFFSKTKFIKRYILGITGLF